MMVGRNLAKKRDAANICHLKGLLYGAALHTKQHFVFLLRIRTPVALDIQRPTKSACSVAGVFWPRYRS